MMAGKHFIKVEMNKEKNYAAEVPSRSKPQKIFFFGKEEVIFEKVLKPSIPSSSN